MRRLLAGAWLARQLLLAAARPVTVQMTSSTAVDPGHAAPDMAAMVAAGHLKHDNSACLCVWDVDRTLTGEQGSSVGAGAPCPDNRHMTGVVDTAYGGGTLSLSQLSLNLHTTFCAACYMGVISSGPVSGSGSSERYTIVQKLRAVGLLGFGEGRTDPHPPWSDAHPSSPLRVNVPEGSKQDEIVEILDWYRSGARGRRVVDIADDRVFFFDDKASNVEPFAASPYNARQVSCASRDAMYDPKRGLCGGRSEEVRAIDGVFLCGQTADIPRTAAWRSSKPPSSGIGGCGSQGHAACCLALIARCLACADPHLPDTSQTPPDTS